MVKKSDYHTISDYAVIGNLRTIALVSRTGSIDWCCFPNLDDASVFAAILDAQRGGYFNVSPNPPHKNSQTYLNGTNIVSTIFQTESGELELVDFMPFTSNNLGSGKATIGQEIHRLLKCTKGNVTVNVKWCPRFNYGKSNVSLEQNDDVWNAISKDGSMLLLGAENAKTVNETFGPALFASINLQEGDKSAIVTRWSTKNADFSISRTERLLEETANGWRNWLYQEKLKNANDWAGQHYPLIERLYVNAKAFEAYRHRSHRSCPYNFSA